ncbi:hypothetical protein A2686_01320 [Candidatus Woesebacteria bacterium RIFCSPHIGHO2_01_FULL_38_10]|nr:MAG: hypothetical protein A2686_01320 [Candidatus Woesebacteria bacterium RIFCSPHIGHO2_01_FULL_38_10]
MGTTKYFEADRIYQSIKAQPLKTIGAIKKFIAEVNGLQPDNRLLAGPLENLSFQQFVAFEILLKILHQGLPGVLFEIPSTAKKEEKPEVTSLVKSPAVPEMEEVFEKEEKVLQSELKEEIPDYYELLKVDKTAPLSEIENAFSEEMKKHHPDKFKNEVLSGKMSEEEFRKITEYAQDLNLAREVLTNPYLRENYDKILARQKVSSPSQAEKYAITINPVKGKGSGAVKAQEKTKGFQDLVKQAGFIELNRATIANSGISPYLPSGFSGEQLTTALRFYAGGVRSGQLEEQIEANIPPSISEKEKESLLGVPYLIATFEESDPNLTKNLQTAIRPTVTFQTVPNQTQSSENQIVFARKEGSFNPVVREIVGQGVDIAKKKVEGLASQAIKKGGKKLAGEAVKKGVINLASKAGVSAASIAAGVPTGGLATLIIFLANIIFSKIKNLIARIIPRGVRNFINKSKKGLAAASLALLGVGLLTVSIPLIIIGGLGLMASAMALGGVVAAVTASLTIIGGLIGIALANFFRVFATATGIFVLITTFFVIFSLLIINEGAYLVPYNPDVLEPYITKSDYISVEKTANPSSADNSDLPLTVNYEVRITAKQGSLANIRFQSTCSGSSRTQPTLGCPSAINITANGQTVDTFPPPAPSIISPTEPFVITYQHMFPQGTFNDSLIVDTFTVIADAPGAANETSSDSASVCIGDCPKNCPSGWPLSSGYVTQGAYTPGGYSHHTMEAIDIGASGRPTFTTHTGVVRILYDSCEGNQVHVVSTCEGREFFSEYSHLEATSVSTGTTVRVGDVIGISGNTGSCTTGPHLHYRFRYTDFSNPSYPNNPPYMWTSYIPNNVPRSCTSTASCNTSW